MVADDQVYINLHELPAISLVSTPSIALGVGTHGECSVICYAVLENDADTAIDIRQPSLYI